MKQVVQNSKTGEIKTLDIPTPQCAPNGVLVQTAYSIISTGTERQSISTAKSSLIGKAKMRPDLVKKVLDHYKKNGFLNTYKLVSDRLNSPMPLGYSSSGQIIEVGDNVSNYKIGDLVACGGGGYALHADVNFIPQNLITKLNQDTSLHSAAYTTIGSIAIQGVRQSNVSVGSKVAVIGLGLVGQLTAQILKATGCMVIGIDINDYAIDIASGDEAWSIDHGFNANNADTIDQVRSITKGFGADSVIITAASSDNRPLLMAGEILRDRGNVVIVGGTNIDIPRSPFYDKEIEIKFSRSYGPGRYDFNYEEKGIDYPIGYIRWTENRNMESFHDLLLSKRINPEILTSKIFDINQAKDAFNLLVKPNDPFMGLVIKYDFENDMHKKPYAEPIRFNNKLIERQNNYSGVVNIGFIGLGSFAQSFIMPHLYKNKKVNLVNVCNNTGISSNHVMNKYEFDYCTSNPVDILQSDDNDTIFIASRHNTHSNFILNAIDNNKNIYIEKPIAISLNELIEIKKKLALGYNKILHVGYNRRFSSSAKVLKDTFANRNRPLSILYRINSGFLPKDHWLVDSEIGGGRIIGEFCHFIDFILFITDSKIIKHNSMKIIINDKNFNNNDNFHVQLQMLDGSVATIIYSIDGSRKMPKEYLEVNGDEKSVVIDDFSSCTVFKNGKKNKIIKNSSDKGYFTQISSFLNQIMIEKRQLIDIEQILHGMEITFSINKNLNK